MTLTGYGFGMPGSFDLPSLDRVGDLEDSPDGEPDGIGVFTLTVAPVPEPSTNFLAAGFGVAGFLARRRLLPSIVATERDACEGSSQHDRYLKNSVKMRPCFR